MALGLLGLGGCGSDSETDSNSTAATATLTKAQFVKQADQICRKALVEKDEAVREELESLSAQERAQPSKGTLEEIGATALLPPFKQIKVKLSKLTPPAGDEEAVQAIVAKLEAGIEKAEENLAALSRTNPFVGAATAAKAYGIQGCSF